MRNKLLTQEPLCRKKNHLLNRINWAKVTQVFAQVSPNYT